MWAESVGDHLLEHAAAHLISFCIGEMFGHLMSRDGNRRAALAAGTLYLCLALVYFLSSSACASKVRGVSLCDIIASLLYITIWWRVAIACVWRVSARRRYITGREGRDVSLHTAARWKYRETPALP